MTADAEELDGEKPLAPSHYYARLTQRLIAAVSAPTAEGVLYELDLRLRPSGNKGPVATHFEAFAQVPAQRGLDLGAHGADAGPPDGRRRRAGRRRSSAEIRAVLDEPRDLAALSLARPRRCGR